MTQEVVDWDAIRAGIIPWHPDGYAETEEERHRLLRTPHDDWDRGQGPLVFPATTEQELRLSGLRMLDSLECQIARFIARRYGGAPSTIIISHIRRYAMISEFLTTNAERLAADGLVVVQRRVANEWLSTSLIRVLTIVRYEARAAGRMGYDTRTFNYTRVARAAKRLLADPGGDPL